MAPLTTAARALARTTTSAVPRAATRCLSTTAVRADAAGSSYESPFRGERNTTRVPDFSHYASKSTPGKNLTYSYFVVGGLGAITAMGAKSTIQGEQGGEPDCLERHHLRDGRNCMLDLGPGASCD